MGDVKRYNYTLAVLSIVLLAAIFGLVTNTISTSPRYSPTVDTTSRVTIQNYVSLAPSDALLDGIDFGSIQNLPIENQNASNNYNASNSDKTEYYITVHDDSNINVDFCIRGTPLENDVLDQIPLINYTWEDEKTNDGNVPADNNIPLSEINTKGTTDMAPNQDNYYRFWLDVPMSQAPGTYNNTVYFQGVPTTDPCP